MTIAYRLGMHSDEKTNAGTTQARKAQAQADAAFAARKAQIIAELKARMAGRVERISA